MTKLMLWPQSTWIDKSQVFNDFINDISNSCNRDFCSRKLEESELGGGGGAGEHMFLIKGGAFEMGRGRNI